MHPLITIPNAVKLLQSEQVILYPTEAMYGLGCDPKSERATRSLLHYKRREIDQGLILVAGSIEQVLPWIQSPSDISEDILTTWPGAHTWLFKKSDDCPHWISGHHDTVAIRLSAHPVIQHLTLNFGSAIVSTSANLHKTTPARTWQEAKKYFPNICITQGNIGDSSEASSIRMAHSGIQLR